MTSTLPIEEDEEPMATEPIYLSGDESEYSTPNTTLDHHHESIYIDFINHLTASQLEERSNMGTETVFYPPTANMSNISDDEVQSDLTQKCGNPQQYTSPIPQRRNLPIQLRQHAELFPDTPESQPTEDQGPRDIFRPYGLRNPSTSESYNNRPNISTVAYGL